MRVLSQLAVAIQRHRIYPALSPLCRQAVQACAASIASRVAAQAEADDALPADGGLASDLPTGSDPKSGGPPPTDSAEPGTGAERRDGDRPRPALQVRVGAGQLFVGKAPVPGSAALDDLLERLFRADIEELIILPQVTEKEIARFSQRVAAWERSRSEYENVAEALVLQGVEGIAVRCTERLEVFDFDVLPAAQLRSLTVEREARTAGEGRPEDMSPSSSAGAEPAPEGATTTAKAALSLQRAWVRADTDCEVEPIDMIDLAFLVDSNADLSDMLLGLARGEKHSIGAPTALRETVSELVHLYSDLSDSVAGDRFQELADTLMQLDPAARRTLTRDVLLPDLLQSGKASRVLRLLPDSEIIEAIRTLTDLDVGSTGLAALALRRMELPGERLKSMTRSVREQFAPPASRSRPSGEKIVEASSKIRLESDSTVLRDMRDLAAHDLAVDADCARRLRAIREDLDDLDPRGAQLMCVLDLLPHVRNPDVASRMLESVVGLIRSLLWEDPRAAATRIDQLLQVATKRESVDPEVSAAILGVLGRLIDVNYICYQAGRAEDRGELDPAIRGLVGSLGGTAASACLQALEDAEDRQARRSILDFMCGLADTFAEHLGPHLTDPRWTVVRNSVRVLGFGPPGHEAAIAKLLSHPEKRVVREAFLALGRIGTPAAGEEILQRLDAKNPQSRELAEDAIRRFPAADGASMTARLLSKPSFYLDRPHIVRALIARFMSPPDEKARALLVPLLPLRLQFWRPGLCRLGWTAHAALRREVG